MNSRVNPHCPICNTCSDLLYARQEDIYFKVPGLWSLFQCSWRECRHVFLWPQPSAAEIDSYYACYHTHADVSASSPGFTHSTIESIYSNYYQQKQNLRPLSTKYIKLVSNMLRFYPPRRIEAELSHFHLKSPGHHCNQLLEVGCGSGHNLERLQRLGWFSTGTEIDPVAIQACKQKGLNVISEGESSSLPTNAFDVIIMSHVIEHLPNPSLRLKALYKLLKPNGTLIILTPNIQSIGHCLFRSLWRGLETPRHLHVFSSKSLSRIVTTSGFLVQECRTTSRGAGILLESIRVASANLRISRPMLVRRMVIESSYILAYLLWIFQPTRGEEIFCTAVKDPS